MASCLKSLWCVQARRPFATEVILPKGNIDLLFNFGAPLGVTLGNDAPVVLTTGVWIAGLQVQAMASRPQGEVHLFGASFAMEPGAMLFPFPRHEITGRFRPAVDEFGDVDLLAEQLYETRDFGRRVALLLDWLILRGKSDTRKLWVIRHACAALTQAPHGAGMNGLARSLGLSTRHLRRLFLEQVGVSPGHYLRLSRFIRSLHLMTGSGSLTDVAHGASYFDQAHFCRDFRDIAGITPGDYRARAGLAVGHFFQR